MWKQTETIITIALRTLENNQRFTTIKQMVNQEKGNFKRQGNFVVILLTFVLLPPQLSGNIGETVWVSDAWCWGQQNRLRILVPIYFGYLTCSNLSGNHLKDWHNEFISVCLSVKLRLEKQQVLLENIVRQTNNLSHLEWEIKAETHNRPSISWEEKAKGLCRSITVNGSANF